MNKLALLIFVFLLSARVPAPEQALRLGTNIWPGYEPLYLAHNLGYYKNTKVRLVALSSASAVISEMRNKTLAGAALTLVDDRFLADGNRQ